MTRQLLFQAIALAPNQPGQEGPYPGAGCCCGVHGAGTERARQPLAQLYQEPYHRDGRTGCPEALRGLGQTPCVTSTVSPRLEPCSEVGVLSAQVP